MGSLASLDKELEAARGEEGTMLKAHLECKFEMRFGFFSGIALSSVPFRDSDSTQYHRPE